MNLKGTGQAEMGKRGNHMIAPPILASNLFMKSK